MKNITATVVVCASCEDTEHSQNCLDCPNFCGLSHDEIRDIYTVKCGYAKMKKQAYEQ